MAQFNHVGDWRYGAEQYNLLQNVALRYWVFLKLLF